MTLLKAMVTYTQKTSFNTGFFTRLDEILRHHVDNDLEAKINLLLKSAGRIDEKYHEFVKTASRKTNCTI